MRVGERDSLGVEDEPGALGLEALQSYSAVDMGKLEPCDFVKVGVVNPSDFWCGWEEARKCHGKFSLGTKDWRPRRPRTEGNASSTRKVLKACRCVGTLI